MDHHLLAVVEDEYDGREQSSSGIETEPKFAMAPVVFLQGLDSLRPVGGLNDVFG